MSAPIKVYFFGCWSLVGHFLWTPNGVHVRHEGLLPWRDIDGALAPGSTACPRQEQIEGRAVLHHHDGWTALAWWDRSIDTRYGSNAALFAKGTFTAEEMLLLGREHFPHVMARFTYTITTEVPR